MPLSDVLFTYLVVLLLLLVTVRYLYRKMVKFYRTLLVALPVFHKAAYMTFRTFTNGYFLKDTEEKAAIKNGALPRALKIIVFAALFYYIYFHLPTDLDYLLG